MANISFGQNILPKVNNTYSLGNSDKKWNLYVNEINGTVFTGIPDVSGFYTKPSGGIPASDLADTYLTAATEKWSEYTISLNTTTGSDSLSVLIKSNNNIYYKGASNIPTNGQIAMYDNSACLNSTTPSSGDNSTKVATTAFVQTAISGLGSGGGSGLPSVSSTDNGKILQVSSGAWSIVTPNFLTSHQDISGKANSADLATVATSGDYGDLLNKPDLSQYLTSVPTMVGATSDAAGTAGLVPAPAADAYFYLKFLCSNGTWSTVNANAWSGMTASPSDSLTSLTSAQVLARQSSVYTTIKFLSANATPTAYNLAMYDANAYLNSTTASSTDNSTKVATTAFVKSVLPSTMIGATNSVAGASGLVPAPTTGDVDKFLAGDGTYKSGGLPMVILSYGNSTWAEFEAAYNNNVIVYTRASSNSNPATGSQTRMAFMAYVNNATTPTEVEFQYYRSMSSHSATAMGDQVFVYKLTKTGGWSVTSRDASIKQIKVDTDDSGTVSWSGNVVTLKSGLPKVTASDDGKILKVVNGVWTAVSPE